MAYELDPGNGSALRVEEKRSDKSPDFTGVIKTPSGEELKIAMWYGKTKRGQGRFGIKIEEFERKREDTRDNNYGRNEAPDFDDDIPF